MNQPANTAPKQRWPRKAAIEVARELCRELEPYCERLVVAGSLRRMREDVGDVEILFIPRMERHQVDLLKWAMISLADVRIGRLLANGTITQRRSKIGTVAWGDKNKLAVHRSGIPVDLFATTQAAWFNYLVCRTGPAAQNVRIAAAAKAMGFAWHPYRAGFTHLVTGAPVPMESEEAVFEFVGLPYLEPKDRL